MPSNVATKVLMVRPRSFRCNEETKSTNAFQPRDAQAAHPADVATQARAEFDALRQSLLEHGIDVATFDEPPHADTPDALFPNNWFAFLPDGPTFLFPMEAENRRREVQPDWLLPFCNKRPLIDLRSHGQSHEFLEGTGSLILDHRLKQGYACLSSRTHPKVIADFSVQSGYQILTFTAVDLSGIPFYHTNVMMALGSHTAILCTESIVDLEERSAVLRSLEDSGRRVIPITLKQVKDFCGNILQLSSRDGQFYWVCSDRAFTALTPEQKSLLEADARIIHVPLTTIENLGGGSARCMLGEIF